MVRALGGEYLALRSGVPTGFNPLQLPPTPANVEFLRQWLTLLARPANVREENDLFQALRGTLALTPEARRLSRLVEFVDATDPNGLYPRLARWAHSTRRSWSGRFAGHPSAYSALAHDVERLVNDNAVLADDALAAFTPEDRSEIEAARRTAAMLQALSNQSLETTSARFDSIQELIGAIARADDPKAIAELQARIGAEQGMLQN